MNRFLRNRRGIELAAEERDFLEAAVCEEQHVEARVTLVRAGEEVGVSRMLVDGFLSRYIDDRKGLRQLVAIHVPGEFVDLHAYPMHRLDHSIASLSAARIALVPHSSLDKILADRPALTRKLWFSTLIDASIHRAWLFRIGRLDSVGRVAHFLSEMNARLEAVGLSDGRRFALNITQADLAEACGLTSVHINRVMRQLREAELCVFRSSMADILDRAALERRGDFDPQYLYIEKQRGTGLFDPCRD